MRSARQSSALRHGQAPSQPLFSRSRSTSYQPTSACDQKRRVLLFHCLTTVHTATPVACKCSLRPHRPVCRGASSAHGAATTPPASQSPLALEGHTLAKSRVHRPYLWKPRTNCMDSDWSEICSDWCLVATAGALRNVLDALPPRIPSSRRSGYTTRPVDANGTGDGIPRRVTDPVARNASPRLRCRRDAAQLRSVDTTMDFHHLALRVPQTPPPTRPSHSAPPGRRSTVRTRGAGSNVPLTPLAAAGCW